MLICVKTRERLTLGVYCFEETACVHTESPIQTHMYKNINVINIPNYTSLDQKDKSRKYRGEGRIYESAYVKT